MNERNLVKKQAKHKIILLSFLLLFSLSGLRAQFYSVKTDALGLLTGTINGEASMMLNLKWSAHFHAQYNPWTLNKNKKIKNLTLMPGVRYWRNETYSQGWFIGVNGLFSQYNVGGVFGMNHRYEGYAAGIGGSWGYSYPIKKRWNIETEFGLAFGWTHYKKYPCKRCGKLEKKGDSYFVAPDKIAVSIVYLF